MPSAKIPYYASLSVGMEALADAQFSQMVRNALAEPGGVIRKRPGIKAYQNGSELGEIIGITVWRENVIYVTADRKIHKLPASLVVEELSDTTAATQLDGTGRPVFADGDTRLIIAGGGALQKWEPGAPLTARLGGDPPACTHVCALGQRLVVAERDTGYIVWSGLGQGYHETWDADAYLDTEARPDWVMALCENNGELYAFGQNTLQLYNVTTDPDFPYGPSSTLNLGCGARYSPIPLDTGFAWLTDRNKIMVSNGREFSELSIPISSTLRKLAKVDDCWGYRMSMDACDFLVWNFPTANTSYVFDTNGKRWMEWKGFSNGKWVPIRAGAYCWNWHTQQHLVGDTEGTGVVEFDMDTYDDLGDPVVLEIRTGYSNEGADVRKRCTSDNYVVKTGVVPFGEDNEYFEVRHRDDRGQWSPWRQLPLGVEGEYDPDITDWCGGVYFRRQRAMRYTGSREFSMAGASTDFEVLE